VLVNPVAGRRRHNRVPEVLAALARAGRATRVLSTADRAEAQAACHAAVIGGAAALVAVGGDGTLHLALQAVATRPVGLGIVPAGTGNDFAAAVGVPGDPVAAAERIASALTSQVARAVDLARVDDARGRSRWYAGVLAAGFDAAVNARANRMRFPRGPSRYHVAILVELARLPIGRYELTVDGQPLTADAVLLAISNSGQYGGGLRIVPGADLSDGRMEVVIGRAMSRRTLIRLAAKLRSGTHLEHPLVSVVQARVVEITSPGGVTFADGEEVFAPPLTARCVPGALTLIG
jgi:diacylglycerol kinase (ATP)